MSLWQTPAASTFSNTSLPSGVGVGRSIRRSGAPHSHTSKLIMGIAPAVSASFLAHAALPPPLLSHRRKWRQNRARYLPPARGALLHQGLPVTDACAPVER